MFVLNLIINGLLSISNFIESLNSYNFVVLNLIINGLLSISTCYCSSLFSISVSFKPYYKWITFNMNRLILFDKKNYGFKPYYKWITFNIVNLHNIKPPSKFKF